MDVCQNVPYVIFQSYLLVSAYLHVIFVKALFSDGDMQDQKSVKVLAESLRRKWNDLNKMLERRQNELDEYFEVSVFGFCRLSLIVDYVAFV